MFAVLLQTHTFRGIDHRVSLCTVKQETHQKLVELIYLTPRRRFPLPRNNTNMSLSTAYSPLLLPVTMLYGGVERAVRRDLVHLCSDRVALANYCRIAARLKTHRQLTQNVFLQKQRKSSRDTLVSCLIIS